MIIKNHSFIELDLATFYNTKFFWTNQFSGSQIQWTWICKHGQKFCNSSTVITIMYVVIIQQNLYSITNYKYICYLARADFVNRTTFMYNLNHFNRMQADKLKILHHAN